MLLKIGFSVGLGGVLAGGLMPAILYAADRLGVPIGPSVGLVVTYTTLVSGVLMVYWAVTRRPRAW